MFLIYGTPDCQFCQKAKILLTDNSLTFTYQDLTDVYPTGWRQVFTDLKTRINGCTKIPLIFKSADGTADSGSGSPASASAHPLSLDPEKWEFIGGYFELEELIDSMDINLNDKY